MLCFKRLNLQIEKVLHQTVAYFETLLQRLSEYIYGNHGNLESEQLVGVPVETRSGLVTNTKQWLTREILLCVCVCIYIYIYPCMALQSNVVRNLPLLGFL
jgi:hypothetical protein